MFSWLSQKPEIVHECYENVAEGLKSIYKNKMLPLEQHYLFEEFHSPSLNDPDFESKPLILLVGQYSTGKTTFIKYLLERDFPRYENRAGTDDRQIYSRDARRERRCNTRECPCRRPQETIQAALRLWKFLPKQISVFTREISGAQRDVYY
jgi:hypothetical protein